MATRPKDTRARVPFGLMTIAGQNPDFGYATAFSRFAM